MYVSLKNVNQCTFLPKIRSRRFCPRAPTEGRREVSRLGTYINVFHTHRLGLVKIYKKIIKEEPKVERSKGALLFLGKYDYAT